MIRLILLAIFLSCVSPAYGSLLFTLSAADGILKVNGGPNTTTAFSVDALVTNTTLTSGVLGSDRYSVATAWFTMPSAGLNHMLINTVLFIDIGLPNIGIPTALTLTDSATNLAGVYNAPAIAAWDRISPLGPITGLAGVATFGFGFTLSNGTVIAINTFDSGSNGSNDGRLQVQGVPEPASAGLVGAAGLALAALRLRRRRLPSAGTAPRLTQ